RRPALRGTRRGEYPQEVPRIEFIADGFGTIAECGFKAADRVAPSFGMRVVAGKEIEIGVRLVDERADLLEDIRRESHLLDDLLGWFALGGGYEGVVFSPDSDRPVEPGEHRGYPSRAEFDCRTTQPREPFEHTIDEHHREEGLDRLMQYRHV